MHKVWSNYSICIRSSENIHNNIGGAQEKGKRGQNKMKLNLPQKMVH